jgi:branched-chain amino acid transport system substrate-binding protein
MRNLFARWMWMLFLSAAFVAAPARSETVKIAFIDPASGPFSGLVQTFRRNLDASIAEVAKRDNWPADFKVEITPFDNKGSPQESIVQLNAAIDQGYRYVMQGFSSSVALALVEAINKHNERNPGKEVLLLNFVASDPDLTNSKCSFWHFRFEPNVDMWTEAITSYMAQDPTIKKVYILGPNYAMGQQASRATREYLKRKKPSIEIVGDDLVPLGQVKDYSPYIAKIKSSGADMVMTVNYGPDLVNLIKAGKDANLKARFFALLARNQGVATALGAAGVGRVNSAMLWNANNAKGGGRELIESYKKKYPNDDITAPNSFNVVATLAAAMRLAKSTDPVAVAFAMEGLKVKGLADDIEMRKSDHQLQQPIYITAFDKVNGKDIKYDLDNSGYGWRNVQRFDAFVASQPTSCQMKRPPARVAQ